MSEGKKLVIVAHSWGGIPWSESVNGCEMSEGRDRSGVIHVLLVAAFVGCKGESLKSLIGGELPPFLSNEVWLVLLFVI